MSSRPLAGLGGAVLALLLCVTPSWANDTSASTPLSPEAAVAAALDVHPMVQQAEANLLLAQGQRRQASIFLNNPKLMGKTSLDGGARTSLVLTQPVSLSGEGWFARSAAKHSEEGAAAALDRARLVVAAQTRQAYVEATVAVGKVRVAEDGVALATRLRQAVARQLEEGEVSTLDLRLAALSEAQAAAKLLQARQTEAEALRSLAAQLGQPLSAETLLSDPLALAPLPKEPSAAQRTDLVAAQANLRAAEAQLRRQRAATVPMVGVGGFFSVEDGQPFMGPSVGLTLPLFDRNQSGRRGAKGQVAVADAQLTALTAQVDTEVRTAQGRFDEATRLEALSPMDPLAEAHAALESVEAGYLAGELDLPNTVLLQGVVLSGEAAAIQLLGGVASARLDLLLATEDPALLRGAQ